MKQSDEMREFLVADLNTSGELQMRQTYSYEALEQIPGAIELIAQISAALWQMPTLFTIPFGDSKSTITIRWVASAETSGIATVRQDAELMSLSILASGLDRAADSITIQAFQSHLLRELHGSEFEPAFALMDLDERPLVATINFRSPPDPISQRLVALSDRCIAASYFRFHKLL